MKTKRRKKATEERSNWRLVCYDDSGRVARTVSMYNLTDYEAKAKARPYIAVFASHDLTKQ